MAAGPGSGFRGQETFRVDTYRQSVHTAGFTYVASFEMYDEHGHDLDLVFATRSKRGLEKMKDALWKVDPARGVHFRDPRDPDQLGFDFTLKPELAPLRRSLLQQLRAGDRSVAELKEHALLETVYRPPHVGDAVRAMLATRQITRTPGKGKLTSTTCISLATATAR